MSFSFWLSLFVLGVTAIVLINVARGMAGVCLLKNVAPVMAESAPSVSVVVSALNEAQTLEPALRSLLAMDYPRLELVVINDRSTDATPEIIERLGRLDARVKLIHVAALPPDWLGKNHALWVGSAQASGRYLLFTDADVVFEPSCVARAVALCEREGLDHLTVAPDVPVNDSLLAMLLASFTLGMLAVYKPWKVRHSPRHYLGLGAFNLVRREAYERSGGHAAIPMAVLDDLMLGKQMKQSGARQDVALGQGLLSVAWYRSPREMINGLQKNLFAALDYRLSRVLAATAVIVLFGIWPWLALGVTHGASCWLNAAMLTLLLAFHAIQLRVSGWRTRALFYMPAVAPIGLWMMWRATVLTLLRGGIDWRGTFYPLELLRRHDRARRG